MKSTSRVGAAMISHNVPGSNGNGSTRHGGLPAPHATLRRVDEVTGNLDHFVEREGLRFAGTHLIIDLWRATNLDDLAVVDGALRKAAEVSGATLLNLDLHRFTPNGGITGVAILAESHISVHTWPECGFAAVDVFMCGKAEPQKAIEVLREAFKPGHLTVSEHKRGVMP